MIAFTGTFPGECLHQDFDRYIYIFFVCVCLVSMPNQDKGRYFSSSLTVNMLVFNKCETPLKCMPYFMRADAHLIQNETFKL